MVGGGGAAIDEELVMEPALLVRGKGPVIQAGNVRVDEALFVHTPGGRVIWILGMVKDGDAESVVAEGTFDGAPGGALLLGGTSDEAI